MNNVKADSSKSPILNSSTLNNKMKYIEIADFEKLKKKYLDLLEKYQKVKNENKKLKQTLSEMESHIDEYKRSKNSIEQYFNMLKSKFSIQTIEHIKNQNKFDNLSPIKFNFQLIGSNLSQINYSQLNEKYIALKEEHNKCLLSKLCSTSNSTNLNKNDKKFQMIKNALIDNYLNSIEIISNNNANVNSDLNQKNINILYPTFSCEPVPSFMKCLKNYH